MLKKQLITIFFTLCVLNSYAQVNISGTIYDEYLEPFYNAKITNGRDIALSDADGNFSLTLKNKSFPQTIKVSAFGFKTETVLVTSTEDEINIVLKENFLLDKVIISASRIPERILESPVTVERMGLSDIRKNTSNSFYDGVNNLKGINARGVSYGYNSINARGFSDFSNSRFVQLVDGMDSAAPALNFSLGNLNGVSELDIHSIEILPGASSALYGANAYNGIMLLNTKNPFDFTGISTIFKSGYTSQKQAGNNPFYDASIRMAYKFSDAFAAKVNFSYFEAEEWHANDTRNRMIDSNELYDGTPSSTTDYDGVNIYGDELIYDVYLDLNNTGDETFYRFRRDGYTERELLKSYKSKNLKFNTALHFRPMKDESLEIQLSTNLAIGDNIFQGTSRYAQRNSYMAQSKLELKGNNFYLRGYYTRNDSGDSYDLTRTGILLNESSYPFESWVNDFMDKHIYNNKSIQDARNYANRNRLKPGTSEFDKVFNKVTNTLLSDGGSALYDKSIYTHADGNYNFRSLLNDWADIQIGGSYRHYTPDSRGTVFNDKEEEISIKEYGIYSQIQKKFFDERLKLTGSIRYDKSEKFEGNISPRFAVNYSLGKDKQHIVRASYQTGFRNPTIQEQYLFLNAASKKIIGSSSDNLSRVKIENINDYGSLGSFTSTTTGNDIINNALLTRSVYDFDFQGDSYIKSDYTEIQPEVVKTIELGYRSILHLNDTNSLDIDFDMFYSKHNNFVFFQDIVVPNYGKVYPYGTRKLTATELSDPDNKDAYIVEDVMILDSDANIALDWGHIQEFNIITNSKSEVSSYGFALGIHTKFFKNYNFGVNYNFIDFEYTDEDHGLFEPNFNTPKHTVKVQFGNERLFNNFGFNINARWQDKYRWVSTFATGNVDSRTVVDAQLNYRIPSLKSRLKIGGTNLFGKEYYIAPGTGQIGQLYYISWTINN